MPEVSQPLMWLQGGFDGGTSNGREEGEVGVK